MSHRIKPKENMCTFQMKETGQYLDGLTKGKKKGAT